MKIEVMVVVALPRKVVGNRNGWMDAASKRARRRCGYLSPRLKHCDSLCIAMSTAEYRVGHTHDPLCRTNARDPPGPQKNDDHPAGLADWRPRCDMYSVQ